MTEQQKKKLQEKENPNPSQKIPSLDEVKEWTKKDLQAATYFLGMLQRYPEIIDAIATLIHHHAKTTEQGAAVDKLKTE